MNRMSLSLIGLALLISACTSTSTLSGRDRGHAMPAVTSGAHSERRKFNIPAEDARVALNEWSRQANLQLLFDYSALGGRQTHAVQGRLPPVQALEAMLKDTGLNVSTVNENTLAIGAD